MEKDSKIYLAGHEGAVGPYVYDELKKQGYNNIIVKDRELLDLRNQENTNFFILKHKPDYVILNAALVGGIKMMDELPGDFLYDNLIK